MVFRVGLILLSLTSVILFGIVWMAVVVMRPMHHIEFLKGLVPLIVGGRLPVHRRIHDETRGSPSLSNLT